MRRAWAGAGVVGGTQTVMRMHRGGRTGLPCGDCVRRDTPTGLLDDPIGGIPKKRVRRSRTQGGPLPTAVLTERALRPLGKARWRRNRSAGSRKSNAACGMQRSSNATVCDDAPGPGPGLPGSRLRRHQFLPTTPPRPRRHPFQPPRPRGPGPPHNQFPPMPARSAPRRSPRFAPACARPRRCPARCLPCPPS